MENTIIEKSGLVSRETYLQMKEDQKAIASWGRSFRQTYHTFLEMRRKYFHSKGMMIPDNAVEFAIEPDQCGYRCELQDWYTHFKQNSPVWPQKPISLDARSLNIVYGIIRGRKYSEIESKVREGNEPSKYLIYEVCKHYGINTAFFDPMQPLFFVGVKYGK